MTKSENIWFIKNQWLDKNILCILTTIVLHKIMKKSLKISYYCVKHLPKNDFLKDVESTLDINR